MLAVACIRQLRYSIKQSSSSSQIIHRVLLLECRDYWTCLQSECSQHYAVASQGLQEMVFVAESSRSLSREKVSENQLRVQLLCIFHLQAFQFQLQSWWELAAPIFPSVTIAYAALCQASSSLPAMATRSEIPAFALVSILHFGNCIHSLQICHLDLQRRVPHFASHEKLGLFAGKWLLWKGLFSERHQVGRWHIWGLSGRFGKMERLWRVYT